MQSLEEVYTRLKTKKAERKDLKSMFQDQLRNSAQYQELADKIAELKLQKKAIENEIMSRELDKAKLEEMNTDIKSDHELLTDICLNKFLASEPVEIVDEIQVKWVPAFTVKFIKS
jgi:uncharacterized protein (DUF3084 family)